MSAKREGKLRSVSSTRNDSRDAHSMKRSADRRGRKRTAERKASVRKEDYQAELGSDTDLTDVPSEREDSNGASTSVAGARRSRTPAGSGSAEKQSDTDSESDTESVMAAKLRAAGDGDSLLGSGESDTERGMNTDEEEQYIIQRALRKEAHKRHMQAQRGSTRSLDRRNSVGMNSRGTSGLPGPHQSVHLSEARQGRASTTDGDEEESQHRARRHHSMSPDTMRSLGIDEVTDELFEPQDVFGSSSEPSFTDFFASDTGSESDHSVGFHLSPHEDDDELTDDNESDIHLGDLSELDGSVRDPALLAQIGDADAMALLDAQAGAASNAVGNTQVPLASNSTVPAAASASQMVPLLVIEDLDGRLIYARAGDGEAVFGSDGEFEFANDSDSYDSTDDDGDLEGVSASGRDDWRRWQEEAAQVYDDSGDTTDELGDEEMPFPRLLVGSVAPRGGRNTRRARAIAAAKSRRISPATATATATATPAARSSKSPTQQSNSLQRAATAATSSGQAIFTDQSAVSEGVDISNPFELDFSMSLSELARDPQAAIAAAADALGISHDEAANILAGVDLSLLTGSQAHVAEASEAPSPASQHAALPSAASSLPTTPLRQSDALPAMGSFMPTSAKGVNRAVLNGSNQAPSPFTSRRGLQKRGLAAGSRKRTHRRASDLNPPYSVKRSRRQSSTATGESSSNMLPSESPTSEGSATAAVDPVELDDVVDAAMLWRSSDASSDASDDDSGGGATENGDNDAMSASGADMQASTATLRPRSSSRASASTATSGVSSSVMDAGHPDVNLNAITRWHRIPMGAFRDGQGVSANNGRQHLGAFLLTRSSRQIGRSPASNSSRANNNEHSPFRSINEGATIHMGAAPRYVTQLASPSAMAVDAADPDGAQERRRQAFFVSPILWPVRSTEGANSSQSAAANGVVSASQLAEVPHLELSASRGKVTRREKRERKARRAREAAAETVSVATRESSAATETTDVNAVALPATSMVEEENLAESPATAMPRLRISDASPRGSPAPSTLRAGPLQAGPLGRHGDGSELGRRSSSMRVSEPAPPPTLGQMSAVPSNGLTPVFGASTVPSSGTSSSNHPNHATVPSSAAGLPIYSPLFGGMVSPVTMAFQDDMGEHGPNDEPRPLAI
ncbi:hypothetical protein IE81DRAFT_325999 [Ceraceosorus guamensis]|uniref:Uncharacterized protein n=1 Tax=Ceraceosorus guamensis TaxID=1522189 RepID=A0A316VUL0_9BASI|nr:hypothetical protein IE81DRAFT_325999 [Ceraceosorus guamensis]PWN39951.1 hypothetical protein IE81DRAFT_325999 [Ceraceosorus guamensis]